MNLNELLARYQTCPFCGLDLTVDFHVPRAAATDVVSMPAPPTDLKARKAYDRIWDADKQHWKFMPISVETTLHCNGCQRQLYHEYRAYTREEVEKGKLNT